MIANVWQYLKGLTIIHWAVKALKALWPFLLILIFWPEIDALLSSIFPFWSQYMGEVSAILSNATSWIRSLPGLEQAFAWLDNALAEIKVRIVNALSR